MQFQLLSNNFGQFFNGPLLLIPKVHQDERGAFLESWNKKEFTRLGIAGMRERVEALGGNFEISETPNTGGVIVLADLPLKH